jgi:hypothetical protein
VTIIAADRRRRFGERALVASRDRDARTLRREETRRRQADTAVTAGDKGRPFREPHGTSVRRSRPNRCGARRQPPNIITR